MRESEIEKEVCLYAKSKGWLTYKFISPSSKGVPDRILLNNGKVIFIEFKANKKLPTKLQNKIISNIRSKNIQVYVIDNINDGKKLIDIL